MNNPYKIYTSTEYVTAQINEANESAMTGSLIIEPRDNDIP